MKIKKTYQGSLAENRIFNTDSSSQTDTYSCDYINDSSVVVSPTEPTENDRKKVWMQKGKNKFNSYLVSFSNTRCTHSIVNSNKIILTSTGTWARSECKVSNLRPNETYRISTAITNSNGNSAGLFENDNNFVIQSNTSFNSRIIMNSNSDGDLIFTIYVNWSGTSNTNSATFDELQITQGSEIEEYEDYIESKIYIKNDNDVYEEFMKKEEQKSINYFSSNCYDNTKIEPNLTNMQQIILKDNEIIINLSFIIKDDNGLGIDYVNWITLPVQIRPSKNFAISVISPSANALGFGYYQSSSGHIRIKMFSKIAKDNEISLIGICYKE